MRRCYIITLLLLAFISCGPRQRVIQKVQGGETPAKLAILPSINLTNDVLGGFVIRNLVHHQFTKDSKNYTVQDVARTDELLISRGITDGVLLNALSNLELCQLLGVDGLVYIDVYDMGMKTLPFYHSRYVDFQVRLFNFNRLVWQKPINIANRVMDIGGALDAAMSIGTGDYSSALTDAGVSVGIQTAVRLGVATLMDHELKPEFLMGIDKLFRAFPYGNMNNQDYLLSFNAKMEILNEQHELGFDLFLDDEVFEAEEVLIDIRESGINIF